MTAKPWDSSQPPDKIGRQVIVSRSLLRNNKTPLREKCKKKIGSDAKLFPARMTDNSPRLNMWRENLPIAKYLS